LSCVLVKFVVNFFFPVVEDELRKSQAHPSPTLANTSRRGRPSGGGSSSGGGSGHHQDLPPPLPPVTTIPTKKPPVTSQQSFDQQPVSPKDRKPERPERPALPQRPPQFSNQIKNKLPNTPPTGRDRSVSSTTPVEPKFHPEPRKSASLRPQHNKERVPLVPSQTSRVTQKNSKPLPPGRPRQSRHGSVEVTSSVGSNTSESTDFSSLQSISDDPNQIMDEITRISANLIDIASDSFSVFNRSLEHFAQLSEKMLQLVQTQNTSHLVSTRIAIGKLREKIGDFRNLLTQINSNPSFDYTTQLEVSVNGISKSCRDLYGKLYANK